MNDLELDSDRFTKLAENFGEMSRIEICNLLNKRNSNTDLDLYLSLFSVRDKFTKFFGWSIPCKEAVDLVKKFTCGPLYDVMAGTGYWARILKRAGVDVRASDIHKILSKNSYHRLVEKSNEKIKKIKIRRKNAIKIAYDMSKKRIKGDIFLSWPPYQSCVATEILECLPIDTKVFYIGEGDGGCTGDLSFHMCLNKNFQLLAEQNLPNFMGIHDYLGVYQKKHNREIDKKYRGETFFWESEQDCEITNDV
jgi:hypothetical protein